MAITPFPKILEYLKEPLIEPPPQSDLPLLHGLVVTVLGDHRYELVLLRWVLGGLRKRRAAVMLELLYPLLHPESVVFYYQV